MGVCQQKRKIPKKYISGIYLYIMLLYIIDYNSPKFKSSQNFKFQQNYINTKNEALNIIYENNDNKSNNDNNNNNNDNEIAKPNYKRERFLR